MLALYVTHPQVRMDPNVPVPLWGLSEEGRRRAEAFAARGVIPSGAPIFSSSERKAVELAEIIAAVTASIIACEHAMGENDRSATGFLPPELFEATADRFFGAPETSIDGWERAIDACARIVDAVATALAGVSDDAPVVFCGHGAVGTLLKCHVGGRAITRAEDRGHTGGPGGGNGFVFDFTARQLHSEWTRIEDIAAGWHQR
ncbi:phosphoglycerate mutase family protein [Devosia sp. A8/3-2]|nr:phosphoglycerate mutase family protein [Devosia sp. A8/3-2]